MMTQTKYIVIQLQNETGMELAFTFPASMKHDDFLAVMRNSQLLDGFDLFVVGAGFYDHRSQEVSGDSISLGVKSRDRDALVIRKGSV
jgi:hypothetical protein